MDRKIDHIFEHIDEKFQSGNFNEVNEMLKLIKIDNKTSYELIAYLSITLLAKDKLPYRTEFMAKVRERLEVITPDRVEKLMKGLE
jgi:hypothetical protein